MKELMDGTLKEFLITSARYVSAMYDSSPGNALI